MVHQESITLQTAGHRDMHDITSQVSAVIGRSRIGVGTAHLFNIGSTAVIGTIEFEPGLQRDLPEALDRLFPPSLEYGHEKAWRDGNGHSHLQASVLGPELTVPVRNGEPLLGTWQQIFHLECDIKPHSRRIIVTVMGE